MTRRLLDLLRALSLLLCVAVVALWVRSYSVSDAIMYGGGAGECGAQSLHGAIVVVTTSRSHTPRTFRWDSFDGTLGSVWGSHRSLPNRLGFGYVAQAVALPPNSALALPAVIQQRLLVVPLWFLVALFASLPLLRLYAALRRRRIGRLGLCSSCGYDLRATPGRCPECGMGTEATPTA
jgi:hypothetical protein